MIFSSKSKQSASKSNASGFTLVEIAISLIIIGILIAGILRGQELIMSARIKTMVKDVNSYRSAAMIFQDTYGALPGDLANPGITLPGCATTAACNATGGNGDSLVGTPHIANWKSNDQSDIATEPTQFWVQLSIAGLVSGVSNEITTTWGDLYPASPLGGGFQVVNAMENGTSFINGNYFILREEPTGNPDPSGGAQTVLTPAVLAKIDMQFDDGMPNSGTIIAGGGANCWSTTDKRYEEANGEKACLAGFKL